MSKTKLPIASSSIYQRTQFKLVNYFIVILLILLPILAVVLFLFYDRTAIPTLAGFLCMLVIYTHLRLTKKYIISAKLLSVTGLLLCQYTLLFFPQTMHFVDTMWIMVVVLFTYFTIGKLWGTIILIINILGVCWYIIFLLNDNLSQIKEISFFSLIGITINFIICSVLITYMMMQFIKLNKESENNYRLIASSLKDKNEEKTVLLKEVHHRVKNNLQVIISLLRLQLQDLNDENLVKPYNESINRVMAMSLIHEKIYQSADLAKIDLKNYIETLISDLISSYDIQNNISYHIVSEIESINIKNLVPTALLLNELISNSIQHGFINSNRPIINVKLIKQNSALLLDYSDNGEWINVARKGSLGMELISSLAEQLNGKFTRKTDSGTHYFFEFEHFFI